MSTSTTTTNIIVLDGQTLNPGVLSQGAIFYPKPPPNAYGRASAQSLSVSLSFLNHEKKKISYSL
ncbi:MAG: hypothetical protein LBI02_02855 [Opitutaceae bacterium]|nr:hypothetical protein [Opitutaceae bacterium]